MKIFITGATGFIGTHLCQRLHEQGYEIIALLRSPSKQHLLPPFVKLIQGDLKLFSDKSFTLPKCDIVIHLAGIIIGRKREDYFTINFNGVRDLVQCVERQDSRPHKLIFISSLSANGPTKIGYPISEENVPNPIDIYGLSKLKADHFLTTTNIPTISLRPALVLGPGNRTTLLIYKLAKKGLAIRPSGPPQALSFIYVDDLVDAIIQSIKSKTKPLHQTYLLSHPQMTSTNQIYMEMAKIFRKKIHFIIVPRILLRSLSWIISWITFIIPFKSYLDRHHYKVLTAEAFICSGKKFEKDFKWTATHDISKTIKKSIKGYQRMGWL